MPGRARLAFCGALAGAALLIATWFAAFHVGVFERTDRSILIGFIGLDRPHVHAVAQFLADLCDPRTYPFLAAVPISVALIRRRPRLAIVIALIMLGANESTHLLKPLMTGARVTHGLPGGTTGALPSGHATAAMSLALCAVIAVPARIRPLVAATVAAFAISVCYSILELGWHYPSDVLAGLLVATTWTLVGMGALWTAETHGRRQRPRSAITPARTSVAAALVPTGVVIAAALVALAAIVAARPHALVYAAEHAAFTLGAAAIAALALTIATGATLALRR